MSPTNCRLAHRYYTDGKALKDVVCSGELDFAGVKQIIDSM